MTNRVLDHIEKDNAPAIVAPLLFKRSVTIESVLTIEQAMQALNQLEKPARGILNMVARRVLVGRELNTLYVEVTTLRRSRSGWVPTAVLRANSDGVSNSMVTLNGYVRLGYMWSVIYATVAVVFLMIAVVMAADDGGAPLLLFRWLPLIFGGVYLMAVYDRIKLVTLVKDALNTVG